MMRLFLFILPMCMYASLAYAQQTISSLCSELSPYLPIENARYVSDSDVPADLNAVQEPILGTVSIPIEIDLIDYFDRPDLRMTPGLNLEPDIAYIEVNQDGSIYYNGQEISADIQRTCGTPVPVVTDIVEEPLPPPIPKLQPPPPKPKVKPAIKKQPKQDVPKTPKKSSVRVFNGPKSIIGEEPKLFDDVPTKKEPEKPAQNKDNSIDVEELNAQDNKDETINGDSDDDSILEGQYP